MLNRWVEYNGYKAGVHQWMEEALILDLGIESRDFQLELYYPL